MSHTIPVSQRIYDPVLSLDDGLPQPRVPLAHLDEHPARKKFLTDLNFQYVLNRIWKRVR